MNPVRKSSFALALLVAVGVSAVRPAQAGVSWVNNASGLVDITQTITGGPGAYTYHYTINNVGNAAPIWWVVLYNNNSGANSLTAPGDGTHTGWGTEAGGSFPGISAPDGQSTYVWAYTKGDSWPGSTPNGIALGQSLSGFSFTSSILDTSAQRFVFDQQGDWGGSNLGTNGNGDYIFTGGGFTSGANAAVPEPSQTATLGLGVLALFGMAFAARKRRATIA